MVFSRELTGWVDQDRDLLASLTLDQQIDYFEKRVNLVSINPISRLLGPLRAEIDGAKGSSTLLIVGVAICCSIEAAGKFVTGGRGGNQKRFNAFLLRYMSNAFKDAYLGEETYGSVLWKSFRNGLAHGFAVCHGGFDDNDDRYFAKREICGRESLMISPYKLFKDFRTGFEKYLADLRSNSIETRDLKKNFQGTFKTVFVLGD